MECNKQLGLNLILDTYVKRLMNLTIIYVVMIVVKFTFAVNR